MCKTRRFLIVFEAANRNCDHFFDVFRHFLAGWSTSKSSNIIWRGSILLKFNFASVKCCISSNKAVLTSFLPKCWCFWSLCYCFFSGSATQRTFCNFEKLHFLSFKKTQKQSVVLTCFILSKILWGFQICHHFLQKVADLASKKHFLKVRRNFC